MTRLAGKVAIVTGSSRGIGAAIARRLAADGASVVVNFRQGKDAADAVVREIEEAGGQALAVQADMADLEQIEALIAAAVLEYGQLDILVNNAGIGEMLPLETVTDAHFASVFTVNVRGVLFATQAAARHFGTQGGRIINISSGAATAAPASMSVYSASKAAVETLTRSHAAELGPLGVTVNAVAPGLTETDMLSAALTLEYRERTIGETPLRRLGQPEDIADVVAFLVSDEARWITGAVIPVSGGLR